MMEPVERVVQVLQDHLDDALAGTIQGIGIVTIDEDGELATAWAIGDDAPMSDLLAAAPELEARMRREVYGCNCCKCRPEESEEGE